MQWYSKAAELGFGNAMNAIGILYYLGYGVSKNYDMAMRWFKKAAELGDENAITNLRELFSYK
jgi:TPR repeat protein